MDENFQSTPVRELIFFKKKKKSNFYPFIVFGSCTTALSLVPHTSVTLASLSLLVTGHVTGK